jgi:medium-chain acyl-[acyl-carrier-protein] hydrolase
MTKSELETWLFGAGQQTAGDALLLCFHGAGGGASLFARWQRETAPGIVVWPIQLPGREHRHNEPPQSTFGALVDDLTRVLSPALDRPFALFGHSMGAAIAFELARSLRARHGLLPAHLFVSAHPACQLRKPQRVDVSAPQDHVLRELKDLYGGIPDTLQAERGLLDDLLRILRADFALHSSYVYRTGEPLDCPISAFGGADDRSVEQNDLAAWSEQTRADFAVKLFSGGHFYLREAYRTVVDAVCREFLRSIVGRAL